MYFERLYEVLVVFMGIFCFGIFAVFIMVNKRNERTKSTESRHTETNEKCVEGTSVQGCALMFRTRRCAERQARRMPK